MTTYDNPRGRRLVLSCWVLCVGGWRNGNVLRAFVAINGCTAYDLEYCLERKKTILSVNVTFGPRIISHMLFIERNAGNILVVLLSSVFFKKFRVFLFCFLFLLS